MKQEHPTLPGVSMAPILSRMEEWKRRHHIVCWQMANGGYIAKGNNHHTFGSTAESALLKLADKIRIKCWKAEELSEMKQCEKAEKGRHEETNGSSGRGRRDGTKITKGGSRDLRI